jgi:dTDP-4-amino-4,6-dideoxygalactose transaminase
MMNTQSLPAVAGGEPIRTEFLVFGSPLIGEEEIGEVVDTMRSGWIGMGPKTARFEQEFAAYIGCPHAIAVNSATAALELALIAAGVGPGAEVITSLMTFAATANVVMHVGARPVFADIVRETQNIDPALLEAAVTPRTRAIIPVHMAGRPCDMDALMAIARRHKLVVIEDAAHAVESKWRAQKIGAIADFTAFSFYVTKNLTTADGGMLTTANAEWADKLRILRLHGISKDAWKRYSASGFVPYETLMPGYKFNLTDMQAAMGLHQLARVEANLKIRERHFARYSDAFGELPQLIRPLEEDGIKHARHLYTLLLNLERLWCDRGQFVQALQAERIGTGIHFTALHLHLFYRERFGYKEGDYPNAEWVGERTLSLPLSAKLTDSDVDDVIAAVIRNANYYGR